MDGISNWQGRTSLSLATESKIGFYTLKEILIKLFDITNLHDIVKIGLKIRRMRCTYSKSLALFPVNISMVVVRMAPNIWLKRQKNFSSNSFRSSDLGVAVKRLWAPHATSAPCCFDKGGYIILHRLLTILREFTFRLEIRMVSHLYPYLTDAETVD